jgi:hypothetical protein
MQNVKILKCWLSGFVKKFKLNVSIEKKWNLMRNGNFQEWKFSFSKFKQSSKLQVLGDFD